MVQMQTEIGTQPRKQRQGPSASVHPVYPWGYLVMLELNPFRVRVEKGQFQLEHHAASMLLLPRGIRRTTVNIFEYVEVFRPAPDLCPGGPRLTFASWCGICATWRVGGMDDNNDKTDIIRNLERAQDKQGQLCRSSDVYSAGMPLPLPLPLPP